MPTFLLQTSSPAEPVQLELHQYTGKTNIKLQFTSSIIMLHSLLQLLFITICNCKYVTNCYYCNCCCFCLSIEYVCVTFIRHIPKKNTVYVFLSLTSRSIFYTICRNVYNQFSNKILYISLQQIVTAIKLKIK